MANMNDLLEKYKVGRPEQGTPQQTATGQSASQQDPAPTSSRSPEKTDAPVHFRPVRTSSSDSSSSDASASAPGTAVPGRAAAPMPGVFSGGSGRPDPQDALPPPRPRTMAVPGFLRNFRRTLPPLWGVDLALILVSLVGIVLIVWNLQAILLAIASFVLSIITAAMGLVVFLALGAVSLLFFQRAFQRRR